MNKTVFLKKSVFAVSMFLNLACFSASAFATDYAGRIILEPSVPADQAAVLKSDRDALRSLRLGPDQGVVERLLGVSTLSAEDLQRWIEDRVQVIVGENFQVGTHTFTAQPRFAFANPGIFPSHETSTIAPTPGVGATIMSNIGAGIYERGKAGGRLLGLKLEGAGELLFSSPRAGAIKVGPALFQPKHPINPDNASSIGNAIPRLGTLFHESRHSDGNGHSLGFLHAVCPAGHALQGLYACDRNLNGPYTVGGTMIRAMAEACTQCTIAEREALRLRYMDSFGRVIQTSDGNIPSTAWDPTPEGKR